jgi:hypothetical protein
MGYKIIVFVSGAIALICTYLVYMAFAAGDHGGIWLFAAFGLLFAALPMAEIGKMLTRKRSSGLYDRIAGNKPQRTAFVPHWQLMGMITLAVLAILLAILIPLLFNQ